MFGQRLLMSNKSLVRTYSHVLGMDENPIILEFGFLCTQINLITGRSQDLRSLLCVFYEGWDRRYARSRLPFLPRGLERTFQVGSLSYHIVHTIYGYLISWLFRSNLSIIIIIIICVPGTRHKRGREQGLIYKMKDWIKVMLNKTQ